MFDLSDPEDRKRRARLAAAVRWGKTEDRSAATAPGRAAFEQRFLDEADGDPVRAASLRAAYFHKLTQKSIAARRAARVAS